jgi:hypothetical protein
LPVIDITPDNVAGLVARLLLAVFLVFVGLIFVYKWFDDLVHLGQVGWGVVKEICNFVKKTRLYIVPYIVPMLKYIVKETPTYILVGLALCFILYVKWQIYIWGVFYSWLNEW